MFLRAALAVIAILLVLLGIQSWRASHFRDEIEKYQGVVAKFEEAQKTNLSTIDTQSKALADWKARATAQTAAAAAAGDRAKAVSDQLDAQTRKNQELRRELARKDAAVATYLDAGMPRALACQLWPGNCADADR